VLSLMRPRDRYLKRECRPRSRCSGDLRIPGTPLLQPPIARYRAGTVETEKLLFFQTDCGAFARATAAGLVGNGEGVRVAGSNIIRDTPEADRAGLGAAGFCHDHRPLTA